MIKVTKLRGGYRITCSDSEFEALRHMVAFGKPDVCEPEHHVGLSNSAKAVIRREPFTLPEGPLIVTDDRRST